MLDFRYAKNIRKLIQIENAQEKMQDFDLVMEMLMEDSYKQKLEDLEKCKGPMLDQNRFIEYIVMDSCDESQIVEYVSMHDLAEEGYCSVKYRYVFKPNKGIFSERVKKVHVEEELTDLEEGRTLIMSDGWFKPWKLDRLFASDWMPEELEALASMGYSITGITYEYTIRDIRNRVFDDTVVMLRIARTETSEK